MKIKNLFKRSGKQPGAKKSVLGTHAFDQSLISWHAPEYQQHEKSALWYVVAAVIALALVIYGLKTDGWTFSVAIIVFAGTYYLFHRHTPPIIEIKISKMGVKIGRHTISYHNLKGFWIFYDPPFAKKLYFRSTSKVHPDIFVSLEDADPAEVRRVLKSHINEMEGLDEPFSDTLVRIFRL